MISRLMAAVACTFSMAALADTSELLITPNYVIVLIEKCGEGAVGCDQVTYSGMSRTSGKSTVLKGKSLMRMCADGVTPCQKIGSVFKQGNVTYTVTVDGVLLVKQGKKILVEENGEWY